MEQLDEFSKPVDLNLASIEELTTLLHGVGLHRAKAIVAARPFETPEELVSRGILSERRYNRIANRVTASPSAANRPIDSN